MGQGNSFLTAVTVLTGSGLFAVAALIAVALEPADNGRGDGSGGLELSKPRCDESSFAEPLQSTDATEDAWDMARRLLPRDVALYRPAVMLGGFNQSQLLAACISADSVRRYAIRYEAAADSIIFGLNTPHNTPGPPESIMPVRVNGKAGELLYTAGPANGRQEDFFKLYWNEGPNLYEIRATASDGGVSQADMLRIAQSLTAVAAVASAPPQTGATPQAQLTRVAVQPDDTPEPPRPDKTALAQLTQIIEHYGDSTPEPPFSGEMNGFIFRLDSQPQFAACEPDIRPQGFVTELDDPRLADSDLSFEATYVPDGFHLRLLTGHFGDTGHVVVSRCGDTVITVDEEWTSPSGGNFDISRRATTPVLPANFYSADRLEATTINGRPAIVVHPRFDGERIEIYLRDEHSLWTVSSETLSLDELLKVAEGLD